MRLQESTRGRPRVRPVGTRTGTRPASWPGLSSVDRRRVATVRRCRTAGPRPPPRRDEADHREDRCSKASGCSISPTSGGTWRHRSWPRWVPTSSRSSRRADSGPARWARSPATFPARTARWSTGWRIGGSAAWSSTSPVRPRTATASGTSCEAPTSCSRTSRPASANGRGLDVGELAALNPALVHVSITSFGVDGPKSGWDAPDLVALAPAGSSCCAATPTGRHCAARFPRRRRTPVGTRPTPRSIALWERNTSGRGQHCDVSAQTSVMQATQSLVLNHPFGVPLAARVGGGMRLGPLDIRLVWPCQDGTVTITFLFGASAGPFSARLFQWIWEEGCCDEATRDKDWVGFGSRLSRGEDPIAEFDRVKGILERFCLGKTKQQLLDAAMERKLLIAPAATIADVFANEQFHVRDYWDQVEHPELGRTIRYPGPFVRPSTGRLPAPGAPAPPRRAHRGGAGRRPARRRGRQAGPAAAGPGRLEGACAGRGGARPRRAGRLSGLKVLDFMWSLAGPHITRVLADYGATVVRVESSKRIEMGRTLNPFWQDKDDVEASGLFNNVNAGKLGICLDLNTEEGRSVIFDLVRWADVVTEAYSPRAMARWGLDYARLRDGQPAASSCCRRASWGRPARWPTWPASAIWPRRSPASSTPPAGPTGPASAPTAATPTTSRPASPSPRCWPPCSTGCAPVRAATSTSPRPRRRCGASARRSPTTRSTAASGSGRATPTATTCPTWWRPSPGTTAGSPWCARTTRSGGPSAGRPASQPT